MLTIIDFYIRYKILILCSEFMRGLDRKVTPEQWGYRVCENSYF